MRAVENYEPFGEIHDKKQQMRGGDCGQKQIRRTSLHSLRIQNDQNRQIPDNADAKLRRKNVLPGEPTDCTY